MVFEPRIAIKGFSYFGHLNRTHPETRLWEIVSLRFSVEKSTTEGYRTDCRSWLKLCRAAFAPRLLKPLLFSLLMYTVIGWTTGVAMADDEQGKSAADQLPEADKSLPVILLTGFEPFGAGRPPNPSWEGIKDLNGKEWNHYRLVCKELPVAWGAPLEHLPKWIEEYKPVAIFSFGQGGPDSFTVEARSRNQRGRGHDNNGDSPAESSIVADGEAEFISSLNSERFAGFLNKKGFLVRISKNAGRYLCEEALYSLEHLRQTADNKMAVAFCHVPPLGTMLGEQKVTPAYVQQFVLAFLEGWLVDATFAASETSEVETEASVEESQITEVRAQIVYYFESWSNQDMKGYSSCFSPEAVVQLIEKNGTIQNWTKPRFIESQTLFHQNSREKVTEAPVTIDIRMEQNLARAVVFWKLKSRSTRDEGYDHFTLTKRNGRWQIVNLVFYSTR